MGFIPQRDIDPIVAWESGSERYVGKSTDLASLNLLSPPTFSTTDKSRSGWGVKIKIPSPF